MFVLFAVFGGCTPALAQQGATAPSVHSIADLLVDGEGSPDSIYWDGGMRPDRGKWHDQHLWAVERIREE